MSACCGPRCSKVFVILYNILFWVSGCAFVALGAILLYDKAYTFLFNLIESDTNKFPKEVVDYVAYGSMALGGIILFVGFFGCCGALQESKCMVGTYIFFLILICFVEATIGLATLYYWWTFPTLSAVKGQLKTHWSQNYTHDKDFTSAFNHAQVTFKCCGVENGNDYNRPYDPSGRPFNLSQTYPDTCCVLSKEYSDDEPWEKPRPENLSECQKQENSYATYRYDRGCFDQMLRWFWLYILIIGASSGGLALLQILGVLFSLCLMRSIGDEDQ